MRGGLILLAGAVLTAAAATWAFTALKPEAHASALSRPAAPAVAPGNRLFLTKAQLDQAIASGTLDRPVRSLLAVKAPLHFGDYAWDDRGIPAGPTWIRVDLGAQLISVFRSGHEIETAVIVYGGESKQTPAGKLHILH